MNDISCMVESGWTFARDKVASSLSRASGSVKSAASYTYDNISRQRQQQQERSTQDQDLDRKVGPSRDKEGEKEREITTLSRDPSSSTTIGADTGTGTGRSTPGKLSWLSPQHFLAEDQLNNLRRHKIYQSRYSTMQ